MCFSRQPDAWILKHISFIFFHDDLYLVAAAEIRIRPDRIPALPNTVLDAGIISHIYVVEDHRVSDHTAVAYKYILEQYGILHYSIDDTATGNQAVLYYCAGIIFRRRQIVYFCLNGRFLLEEIIPDLRFQKIHIRPVIRFRCGNITPVGIDLITVDPFQILITDEDIV